MINNWDDFIQGEKAKDYYLFLQEFIAKEHSSGKIIYPERGIFKTFELTPLDKVRVVILGQEPYHSINLLYDDLTSWAGQGFLCRNTIFTVEDGKPLSHQNKGWEVFTENAIKLLNTNKDNIIFLDWRKTDNSLLETSHLLSFNRANEILRNRGEKGIDWVLKERNYFI